jgi:hypothetical protein
MRIVGVGIGVLVIVVWLLAGVIRRRRLEAKLNAGQQFPDPD